MKTVLVVAGKLTIGGAERVCRNIGYYADSSRFQINYLVFGNEIGAYETELLKKDCRIFHVAPPSAGYRAFYCGLKELIRANHYDVVHCHTMFNSGLVLRAAKQCGVPIRIAHSHSIRTPGRRSLKVTAYEHLMRRWILHDATHYIGCGKAAGAWLFGREAFEQKGIVLLNGIELDCFRFDPAKRCALRTQHGWQGKFLIGHVGHLASVKNQIFLLRLMPELIKMRSNAHLLLLGDGVDRPMLETAVRELGLQNAVTMPGNVTNVNEYLSAMDVFAFPSLYEGMPLSVVESQANGLPCVLSDRVPKDVHLTDLITALPLEAPRADWIQAICSAARNPEKAYDKALRAGGFDTRSVMEKIYAIYNGKTV